MIASGYGSCSTLIHVIAQHPKAALALGLTATVLWLGSAGGPGYRAGNTDTIRRLSAAVENGRPDSEIRQAFGAVWDDDAEVPEAVLKEIVNKCGCDLSVKDVKADRSLRHDAVFLYFIDLAHAHGVATAQDLLRAEMATQARGPQAGRAQDNR